MFKKSGCVAVLALLCLFSALDEARAQAKDAPKVELGVQFSSLTLDDSFNATDAGFGGRVTYNLTDNVALEAQFDFFPNGDRFRGFRNGGRIAQGLFGVKAGKRFEKFGIFGKVRPGFTSFSSGRREFVVLTTPPPDPTFGPFFNFEDSRETHFATDVGAVLEFYPTRRIVTRFDAGDTIVRYGDTTTTAFLLTGPQTIPIPGETRHNFQFSAGIGFRF